MKRNEGLADRIIRGVVGVSIIGLGVGLLQGNIVLLSIYVVIGLIILVTGIVGFCPLYSLFRFNTLPRHNYEREAPPSRPWAYTNTELVDSRVRSWGRSEGRTAMYRSEENGGRTSKWGTGAESRASSNRTAYRSGATATGKTTWGDSAEKRVAQNQATFRK